MTAAYCLLASLLSLVAFVSAWAGLHGAVVDVAVVLMAVSLLTLLWRSGKNLLVSPVRLYVVSLVAFILARPLINLIFPVAVVEVGSGITEQNVTSTLAIVSLSIGVTSLSYFASVRAVSIRAFAVPVRLRIQLPALTSEFALAAMLALGMLFLYHSWVASQTLGTVDYFSAIDNPEFHAHIRFFFVAKMFGILWLISATHEDRFRACAGLLCAFSVGFLLIGLRGYFLSYLFLWVYFFNEKRKISGIIVVLSTGGLLYLASYVLEYRLGFSVYDSALEMIIMPLYQQGASFEVVFGAVSFPNELSNCLSLLDYFLGNSSFGACVDSARQIPFENGGYASSFFAEAYYIGLPALVLLSALLGFGVRLTQHLSRLRTLLGRKHEFFAAGLILFYVLPNLIYFARSSAFDFVVKLGATLVLCLVLFNTRKWRASLSHPIT